MVFLYMEENKPKALRGKRGEDFVKVRCVRGGRAEATALPG